MNGLWLLVLFSFLLQGPQGSSPRNHIKVTTDSAASLLLTNASVEAQVVELPGIVAECAGVGTVTLTVRNASPKRIKRISYELLLRFDNSDLASSTTTLVLESDLSSQGAGLGRNRVRTIEKKFAYCESARPTSGLLRVQRVDYQDGSSWQRALLRSTRS
jgi:hypothetical protein